MLNEVIIYGTIPKEWEYMKIKSIYKGKGNKKRNEKSKRHFYNKHIYINFRSACLSDIVVLRSQATIIGK